MIRKELRLLPEKLRRVCDPASFAFETTAELDGAQDIIGQGRALRAMEFGLNIKRQGYNIFVAGQPGTGRNTYAKGAVKGRADREITPPDWCYVYNFTSPSQPQALALPGGTGKKFKADVEELEKILRDEIPKAFDSQEYERHKAVILDQYQKVRSELLEELSVKAREHGFALKITNSGFLTVPVQEGREVAQEEYAELDSGVQREIEDRSQQLRVEAADIMRRVAQRERETRARIEELDQSTGLAAVAHHIEEVQSRYKDYPKVVDYLQAWQKDVLANLDEFRSSGDEEQSPLAMLRGPRTETVRYRVNLLVDNSQAKGAPVVNETNPTWYNLLGRGEYQNQMGSFVTDFTKIKAGAFHNANGGYLVVQAMDLLSAPFAWQALKRVLKNQEVAIESLSEEYSSLALSTLRPEPIPMDVKVIVVGTPRLYHLLYNHDEDFKKLFKVKVDFNDDMERTKLAEEQVARLVGCLSKREGLRSFDREAVARVVEHSSRLADSQERLSTHFNELGELLFEADNWAGSENSQVVRVAHVDRAIEEKIYRANRYQELRERMVAEGKLLLTTRGEAVGQVNGLSVLSTGDYAFGLPSRITANTFAGRGGILNIEREIQLSGHIHSKGVLTLSGWLGQRFAQKEPLALSASLTFEQLYSGVEGDSASGAELFALVSSLAEVPIDQGIAVTGSVNQKGEIQPVGGVNEKIEGFFAACKLQGLTGTQGVIIPARNQCDLMLDREVVAAVQAGKFNIYAINTVEEGLEILTGIAPGEADDRYEYPQNTLYGMVQGKLEKYSPKQQKKSNEDA